MSVNTNGLTWRWWWRWRRWRWRMFLSFGLCIFRFGLFGFILVLLILQKSILPTSPLMSTQIVCTNAFRCESHDAVTQYQQEIFSWTECPLTLGAWRQPSRRTIVP